MELNEVFHKRYKLKKFLGRGQFSEVWLAEDVATKVRFALKIYAPATGLDDNGVQMLAREFALLANANHENLLRPSYFDVCDRKPYLVLPYCERGSSQKLIGKMNEDEAWRFIHDVAAGLAYLHSYKPDAIIHQDIKPDNIMIGSNGQYMITDFGISTHSKSALRRSIGAKYAVSGTIAYMGPERFGEDKTPIKASDIYSLGATVFEMITGDVPFGEHGGLTYAAGAKIPIIKGDYSADLVFTIRSCMHYHPWDRPTAETLVRWATNRKADKKDLIYAGSTIGAGIGPSGGTNIEKGKKKGNLKKHKCLSCGKTWESADDPFECPGCHSANIKTANSNGTNFIKRFWWIFVILILGTAATLFALNYLKNPDRLHKSPLSKSTPIVTTDDSIPLDFYCTQEEKTASKPYSYTVTIHVSNIANLNGVVYSIGNNTQQDSVFENIAPGNYSVVIKSGGNSATKPLSLPKIIGPVKPITKAEVQSYLDKVASGEITAGVAQDKICRGEVRLAAPVDGKNTLFEILHELEMGAKTGDALHYTVISFSTDEKTGRVKSGTLRLIAN